MAKLFQPENPLRPGWRRSIYVLPSLRLNEIELNRWITLYPRLNDFWRDRVEILVEQISGGTHQITTCTRDLERPAVDRLRFVAQPSRLWRRGHGRVHFGRINCPRCKRPKKVLRWSDRRWLCDNCGGVGASIQTRHKHEVKYTALETRIDRLLVKLGTPDADGESTPRKKQQTTWRKYHEYSTKLQAAIDEIDEVRDRWCGVPQALQKFEREHRRAARRMPEGSPKWVCLIATAGFFNIPHTTIRTLARDPVRRAFSGLGDVEPRFLEDEKIWIVDFNKFAQWAMRGGYRCEPTPGMAEPEELVALNPAYVSKSQIIEAYSDVPSSHVSHWLRFRDRFGLGDIVVKNGKVLFVHKQRFCEWVTNNRVWASKKARQELCSAVLEYRYY